MGEDQSQTGRRRLTVAEASEVLGITVEAVRGRIKRRTLKHERDSGTVYVLLDADQPPTGHQPADDQATNQPHPDAPTDITEELRDRIRYLERQVEEEREARRRADTILAQLSAANTEQARTIRALEAPAEAPPEARESTQTVEEEQELDTERARREMAESTMREGMDEERRRREEAERERDALRRELYAVKEPRESPETVEDQQGEREPSSDAPGAQEGVQRPQGGGLRGLRRRLLGW